MDERADTDQTSGDEPVDDSGAGPDAEPEADGGAEPEAELAKGCVRGKSMLFVALSLGFVACMCCVLGTFGVTGLAFLRLTNLDNARQDVGAPAGWSTEDATAMPWVAEATLTGTSDAEAVARWLTELGADTTTETAADCLAASDGCTVNLTVNGLPVVVHYDGQGATVVVD